MTHDYTHIVWTDLETTGLSPDNDSVLEVGLILTDTSLNEIDSFSHVVVPRKLDIFALDPFVHLMHTDNGLLNDVLEAKRSMRGYTAPYSIGDVQMAVVGWLAANFDGEPPGGSLALGGSGVSHFDIRFLRKHLPHFAWMLHRSTLDVGVMRRFIENVAQRPDLVPETHRNLEHRALSDARAHLEEARVYRSYLSEIGR